MLNRPSTCEGCSLNIPSSSGFIKGEGYPDLGVTFLDGAPEESDVTKGGPLRGRFGVRFGKMIEDSGYKREQFQILNAVNCWPFKSGEPPTSAIEHCRRHWEPLLTPATKVLVPLGDVALFAVTGEEGILSKRGYVQWSAKYGCWVLPTVHPKFIVSGNANWQAAFMYDLRHAVEIAREGWKEVERVYTLDAGLRQSQAWVDTFKQELARNPLMPVSADLETPDKNAAEDETDINLGYLPGPIYRIGFGYVSGKGERRCISMPWDVNHIPLIKEVLETKGPKIFCPTPNHKVLTADLRWVEAGSLRVGDKLVSFDEYPQGKKTRDFKTGIVTCADRAITKVFAVTLEDGTVVKVSSEHQWLASKRGKHSAIWIKTSELKVGTSVKRFAQPWEEDTSKEAGYLAGFYDGEGSVSKQVKGSLSINASQKAGPTKDYVKELLKTKGYEVSDYKSAKGRTAGSLGLRGPFGIKLKFLGAIRPQRLLRKAVPEMFGSAQVHAEKLKVVRVESLGPQEVVWLSVDAKTYVLEGFAAHNCYRHFDVPRIRAHQVKINGPIHDEQEAWHVLHSDLPKSLERITPYLVPNQPAWKHLNHGGTQAYYNAVDCGVTVEGWIRLVELLKSAGCWNLYMRHVHKLNEILIYMSDQGMPIDNQKRMEASEQVGKLKEANRVKLNEAAAIARPKKVYSQARFSEGLEEIEIEKTENYCTECQKRVPGVGAKHPHFKCGVAAGEVPLGALASRSVVVKGWVKPLDFKPSNTGLIRYATHMGYKLFSRWDKQTQKRVTSMDENNVRKYALKYTEDQVWPLVLEERELGKLLSTYIGRLTDEPEKVRDGQNQWWEEWRAAQYRAVEGAAPKDRMPWHTTPQVSGVEDDDIPF